ncbi:MAG: hypothetical protein AAB480_01785 [Patescibacteria group bacterium]
MRKQTQATTGTANDANLFFLMPRGEGLTAGVRSNLLPDSIAKIALPSVVVGGISRDGKLRKGASVVPALITDRPMFDQRNKMIRASVIDQDIGGGNVRKVLASHKVGNDWIVLIRTGFQFGPQGMMGDYMDLASKGVLTSHGSFNFDKTSGAFKIAEGREEKSDFGQVAAEKIGSVSGRKIKALGYSPVNYDFWRIPEGAVVIVRDVNGKTLRLIGGKVQLLEQDATGYGKFFDSLLAEDVEMRAKLATAASPQYDGVGLKLGTAAAG